MKLLRRSFLSFFALLPFPFFRKIKKAKGVPLGVEFNGKWVKRNDTSGNYRVTDTNGHEIPGDILEADTQIGRVVLGVYNRGPASITMCGLGDRSFETEERYYEAPLAVEEFRFASPILTAKYPIILNDNEEPLPVPVWTETKTALEKRDKDNQDYLPLPGYVSGYVKEMIMEKVNKEIWPRLNL